MNAPLKTTQKTPMIECHVLRSILKEIDIKVEDLSHIFAKEHITIEDIYLFNARIKLNSYMRILAALAEIKRDPLLGLHLSSKMGPEMIGPVGYIFLSSPNLQTAIDALVKHIGSIQEMTSIETEYTESGLNIYYTILSENIYPRKDDILFSIGYIFHLIKKYTNNDFSPLEVHFEFKPSMGRMNYETIFKSDVFFEQPKNMIAIRKEDLSKTHNGFDENLIPILESYLRIAQHDDTQPGSFSDYIGRTISTSISSNMVNAKIIANRVGISEAKLRQKLKAEGTTFKTLLLNKRIGLAKRLLTDSDINILDIAVKCGYSETASFSRAFTKHSNMTPSQYRRQKEKSQP